MACEFVLMFPLLAAYLAEAIKNVEREDKRPPAADVNGLIWMVGCCLKAGIHLAGVGFFRCELSDIEALLKDRARFRDSIFALALREAWRLVLVDLSESNAG